MQVCIILSGRYAGKKACIIKQNDDGTNQRKYPHAIVAGVERYPLKVTKRMGAKKLERRSKIKPFIKVVNYNHLMPTRQPFPFSFQVKKEKKRLMDKEEKKYRYSLDIELKGLVTAETFKEPSQRSKAKKEIKGLLQERYKTKKNKQP